jgi:RNA polymerase sigma-54 factor
MTPQLMQAIKLLQLSNLDLSAYVEGELERNPLLERPARPRGPAGGRRTLRILSPTRRGKRPRTSGPSPT